MTNDQKRQVITTLAGVYAYYEREMTEFAVSVWLEDLEGHAPDAIGRAFVAHRRDPSRGQWMPKSADILRHLQPDDREQTALAWSGLLEEVRRVGSYGRPRLSACQRLALDSVGGWGSVCRADERELPHLQRRFCEAFGTFDARDKREDPLRIDGGLDASGLLPRLQ